MGKAKAGRKRKAGDRFPSGKLRQAWDYGSDGVQRRRATYAMQIPANDAKGRPTLAKVEADHTYDPIGRAWSAGLLVIEGKDPAAIRDAGRDLGALYWRIFNPNGCADSLARFQPSGSGSTTVDRERALESALNHRLAAIRSQGHAVDKATAKLCIDEMWFDQGPAWLDRLIYAKRHGEAPSITDAGMMALALQGLAQIV